MDTFQNLARGKPSDYHQLIIKRRLRIIESFDRFYDKKVVRTKNNVAELRLYFLSPSKARATKCAYDLLNSKDKETIELLIQNIERIVAIAVRKDKDADYWKNVAKLISNNSDYLGAKSSSQAISALKCKTASGIVEVEDRGECINHWLGKIVSD